MDNKQLDLSFVNQNNAADLKTMQKKRSIL